MNMVIKKFGGLGLPNLGQNLVKLYKFCRVFLSRHLGNVKFTFAGDELLTLEEFAAGPHPGSPPLEVGKAFKIFDKMDGQEDGFIYPSSAAALFKSLDGNSKFESF